MEYMILAARTQQQLVIVVNSYLNKGWNLQGGVAADAGNICQAIYRNL